MPRPPLARHCGALGLLLLGACSSGPRPEAGPWAGSYEWFSTFGGGRLDLCNDGTYRLSLTAPQNDGHQQLSGTWSMGSEGSWGSSIVTLTIPEPATTAPAEAPSPWPPVTTLVALLHQGSAQFLGTNGVIDLNQGF